ncbi:MAG: HAMP domain-containing histidine kinase [Solirubrobacterales bacterium]|nr:HAMP domain-containing histidine kinase [Solirubrobacterales bacterium]
MSLRVRMGVAAGVAVAVAVIAVAVSAYAGTRSQLTGQLDNSLRILMDQRLANRGPGGPDAGGGPPTGSGFGFTQRPVEGACQGDEGLGLDRGPSLPFGGAAGTVTLFNRCGGTYVPSGQTYRIPGSPQIDSIARSGSGQYFTAMTVNNTHIRVFAEGIGDRGALAVALPLDTVDKALRSQLLLLALISSGGIALAALLAVLVARAAVAPIERFTRQTEAIAAAPEKLIERQRLEVTGSDELARLARTFNTTLDALEHSLRAQRNLVADASHELRTPIATIRANLQLMRDEHLLSAEDREALRADVIEELDELTALVSDLVELARGGKPSAEPGDVRLDSIVAEALERARRRAPELRFAAALEPTLVRGEGDRIARAISNLLDNAAKWSPDGGVVEVRLTSGVLSVRDHGPGIHEDDLPFVFDRFHRAKQARSKPGSGLGLAIVRQAAEAHGGWVRASNDRDGGARLRISFGDPLASEDADGAAAAAGGPSPLLVQPRPPVSR